MTAEETKTATDLLKEYNITPITIHHSYGYTYESVCELITKLLFDRDTHARQMAVEFAQWKDTYYHTFYRNEVPYYTARIFTPMKPNPELTMQEVYDTFTASTDRKEDKG